MTNKVKSPMVSIGMPVFNGENFLTEALDSILSQTWSDFELIISDNGSTDSTANICTRFANRDKRIHYRRNRYNEGAARNFCKVFELSRGKYFKWAAHDDLLAPEYLEQCVSLLEQQEDIILCHSMISVIDEQGVFIRQEPYDYGRIESDSPSQRFAALVTNDLDNYEVFGVIRREILTKTPLIAGFIASDRTLRAELGLRGKFHLIDAPLFLSRDHSQRSIRVMPGHHQRGQWFAPRLSGRFLFPHWRILGEYIKCIGRVDRLSFRERIQCYGHVLQWILIHLNWARLLADPIILLAPGLEKKIRWIGRKLCNDS